MLKLVSLLGVGCFVACAWALSSDRKRFPVRTVLTGLGLQFFFGLFILRTSWGRAVFEWAKGVAGHLIEISMEGAKVIFGPLANDEVLAQAFGANNTFLFFVVIPATIIVVASISAGLYHYGVLQKVIRAMAWVMQRVMRTSGSESLAAAANIFMGQTEAPLVVKPYLARMTNSELLAMMTGGMATIAGGVFAAYVGLGIDAGHLLAASVMSAPAALMVAKIMLPETQESETRAGAVADVERDTVNGLDALCRGAGDGLKLALNVMAMVIAFVAIVALFNQILASVQGLFGVEEPVQLQGILGWLNAPFAFVMGVPAGDCLTVGRMLGERIVLNEFFGYLTLSQTSGSLDPRSVTIATYALCGFANFGSIAIQIGGIGALVPERRGDLAKLGLRSMIGGVLASYLTAAMVGILIA